MFDNSFSFSSFVLAVVAKRKPAAIAKFSILYCEVILV